MSFDPGKLYQDVILRHNKNPHNFEIDSQASIVLKAYNPVCGDRFDLYLRTRDGMISEIHFHGYGCAISKASTSLLVQRAENQTMKSIRELCERFLQMVDHPEGSHQLSDHELDAFKAVWDYPGRRQCAVLAWEEILKAIGDPRVSGDTVGAPDP